MCEDCTDLQTLKAKAFYVRSKKMLVSPRYRALQMEETDISKLFSLKSQSFYVSNLLVNITRPHGPPACHVVIPTKSKNAASSVRTLPSLDAGHGTTPTCRLEYRALTLRRLMSYIYGAPILDVSRSHTTTQHSR